ncbi:fluoride efflux transporter FluC [Virgibacillus byunsanensis]|uniref:Fluoride-specific ion channel FluC n=1 Tax=Virgibacillus byunsanensis TaxID=570945 RepID=A0ABW3LQE3_9BACI
MSIFLVAVGGMLGSIGRFYIAIQASKRLIGTWITNITGSILFAATFHFHLSGSIPNWLWIFLGIGVFGAFTTFSTFGNETVQLIIEKRFGTAIIYIFSSLIVSLVSVFLVLYILQ